MSALAGKRVLITRPEQTNDGLQTLLSAQGAVPLAFPTIAIVPDPDQLARLDDALRNPGSYDWLIFTSRNAAAFFAERLERTGVSVETVQRIKIAAVGPATARALREHGLIAEVVPDEFVGEAIARSLGDVRGQKVLLPRAQAAREALVKLLTEGGAIVEEIPLYRTVTNRPEPTAWQALEKGVDFVTFTSASTVQGFFEILGNQAIPLLESAVTVCIGPITARALEEHGIPADIVPGQYTADGMVQAMITYDEKRIER